jgi:three-Cys-motif partner protein
MSSGPTLWPIGEHTVGKHLVLRHYLNAWLPILGTKHGRIIFIDGFAGPGEYEGGEEGSPVIALKALREHHALQSITAEVVYLFIDNEAERTDHLKQVVARHQQGLPSKTKIEVATGACDERINSALDTIEKSGKWLAPAFVMLDPFGVSYTPLSTIRRLLKNPSCEIYISVMYEWINRFKGEREFEKPLDDLFGSPDWRKAREIVDSTKRKEYLFDLYEAQLRAAGAKHVVHFELYKGNTLKYAIFFATKHALGCDKMKQAIWKLDPGGGYKFRGGREHEITLFDELGPDLGPLQAELRVEFGGQGVVSVDEVADWIRSDATDYCSSHLKKALKTLEQAGFLTVDSSSRTKRNTYPPGTRMEFKAP